MYWGPDVAIFLALPVCLSLEEWLAGPHPQAAPVPGEGLQRDPAGPLLDAAALNDMAQKLAIVRAERVELREVADLFTWLGSMLDRSGAFAAVGEIFEARDQLAAAERELARLQRALAQAGLMRAADVAARDAARRHMLNVANEFLAVLAKHATVCSGLVDALEAKAGLLERLALRNNAAAQHDDAAAVAVVPAAWLEDVKEAASLVVALTESAAASVMRKFAEPFAALLQQNGDAQVVPALDGAPLAQLIRCVDDEADFWDTRLKDVPAEVAGNLRALQRECNGLREQLVGVGSAADRVEALVRANVDHSTPSTAAFDHAKGAAMDRQHVHEDALIALRRARERGQPAAEIARLEAAEKEARRSWIAAQSVVEREVLALAFKSLDFPELRVLCPAAKLEDVIAAGGDARSATRTLAQYSNVQPLHVGRHQVDRAEFCGATVVLKKFHIGADLDRAAFFKEARRLRQLAHPNVLVLNLVFIDQQLGFLELEFCEQGHLWQWLARQPRPRGERLAVLQQALRGLEHVHRSNVVHCDVKPDNIFVSAAGVAKLADFDVSKDEATRVTRVGAGTVVGHTLLYLAPELQLNPLARATPAADVFAFGLTFFDLLTAADAATRAVRVAPSLSAEDLERLERLDPLARVAATALVAELPSDRPSATRALDLAIFRSASLSPAGVDAELLADVARRASRDDPRLLREEMRRMVDPDCCICAEEPKNTVVSPCRHLAMCEKCALEQERCPVCLDPIRAREKVFVQ